MKRSILILLFFLVSACNSEKNIIIEDYIVGHPYEIVSVDSIKPNRQKHGLIFSYVPFVIVSEGSHSLNLKLNDIKHNQKNEQLIHLVVNVKAGNVYKIIQENGKPTIVLNNKKT